MTVPVFALNRLAHSFSRQRTGMVLCVAPAGTFSDPQCGQRRSMNHASAGASSGTFRMISYQARSKLTHHPNMLG